VRLSTPQLSGVTFAGFAGVAVVFRRESVHEWSNFRHLKPRPSQGTVANFIFYLFATLGWASILWQSYNVALLGAFWPFFAGISLQLLAAMLQFARMMLLTPE
jgi:hypothetical protein